MLEWSANDPSYSDVDVKLVGTEIPVAQNVAGTPKFGYRCLQCGSYSSYITAEKYDYFNMDSTKTYEIEFFLRLTAFGETFTWPDSDVVYDQIVTIYTQVGYTAFNILVGTSGEIIVKSVPLGIDATSARNLVLNTWTHVRVRIDNGTFKIFLNGESVYNGTCSGSITDTRDIRIGGFKGQLDEFLFRQVFGGKVYNSVPAVPYKGYIDTYGIGGNGKQGALNLTSGSSRINTVQEVTFQDSSTVTIGTPPSGDLLGIHGTYQVGDEVLIIKNQISDTKPDTIESGLYCLRRIKDISGTTVTLDSPVTEFTFDKTVGTTKYSIKMHLVPNYSSVTIGSSATVTCRNTDDGTGGLVIFRCQGNVNIQGKILTSGQGMKRRDYFQMTHNHLPERFIYNRGGGVIILSEGTVTAGDNARIGASWSGAGKGGAAVSGKSLRGNNGGSGYGGSGGTSEKGGTSEVGQVGYGGFGAVYNSYATYSAQGLYPGALKQLSGANRGAPCGTDNWDNGNSDNNYLNQVCGSCVMIICKILKVSMNAISTGGQGGKNNTGTVSNGLGGAGTGMCYLAYEEAI